MDLRIIHQIFLEAGAFLHGIFDEDLIGVFMRVLASMFCGGMIGFERGRSNQPAGMRTYMLVCLGAAVVMVTGEYVYREFGAGDPSRLGAQVISGIGFLGAGSIVISGKSKIRGLTTAAGLWVSACIGLVVGIGYIKAGILATLAVYVIIVILKPIEEVMLHRQQAIEVIFVFGDFSKLDDFNEKLVELKIKPSQVNIHNEDKDKKTAVVTINSYPKKKKEAIVKFLMEIEGVKTVKYQ